MFRLLSSSVLVLSARAAGSQSGNGTCATPMLRYAAAPMVALSIPPCDFPVAPVRLGVTSCNYVDACDLSAVAAAGIDFILIDLNWATFDVRPNASSPPVWSAEAWAPVAAHVEAAIALGLRIIVGPGAHVPPQFIWDAGARFVNAGGATYTPDSDAWPNFVFYSELRVYAEQYYAWLGGQLASATATGRVAALRLGGGHYGELSYPRGGPAGGVYWAFDARAAALNPVPWWRPGEPAPNGEAATFLAWYLGALADYQDWQAAVAGAAFPSVPLAMLYPGGEASLADIATAVAGGLPQTQWDPITAGQVRTLLAPALARTSAAGVVWCTSVSGEGSQANLGPMAALSSALGLARGGENVGGVDSPADMLTTLGMARRSELAPLLWLPPHTPGDPGNLTTQLPLLSALGAALSTPASLCGSLVAPAAMFAPSLGSFLDLQVREGADCTADDECLPFAHHCRRNRPLPIQSDGTLAFIATNVSDTPGLRGLVLWSVGPFEEAAQGGASWRLVVNASAQALQLLPASDGAAVWQCSGPAGGSAGSPLFLTVTDGPALRLYRGVTSAPGPFVDVTSCH